jgi:hypothetical protein
MTGMGRSRQSSEIDATGGHLSYDFAACQPQQSSNAVIHARGSEQLEVLRTPWAAKNASACRTNAAINRDRWVWASSWEMKDASQVSYRPILAGESAKDARRLAHPG